MKPKTLLDKIWDAHLVHQDEDSPAILYIDTHLIHEVTSPQAFAGLVERGLKVRRTDRTFGTVDHSLPTKISDSQNPFTRLDFADELGLKQIHRLQSNCKEFGVPLYDIDSLNQGIVHIIGPELGITQPGMTIVCGDSHTATHGAFGALAFGIGTSEVEHVMASQCLLQYKPKSFRVNFNGKLKAGVSSKDAILYLISQIGTNGGTNYVFEYTGEMIESLSMEERMTICNMSIEAGARAGMIAPDQTTFEYLKDCKFSPKGSEWDKTIAYWKTFYSDPNAQFDKMLDIDASQIGPMITYGTNPAMAIAINENIPTSIPAEQMSQDAFQSSLNYMGFQPDETIKGNNIDVVFIGSCTNGRIEDLRQAANIFKNRKADPNTRVLIVAGSQPVKQQAEEEGLDKVFMKAGAEWREPGCSMCIAMNGDQIMPGQYAVSTSNRNFEGRQGKGGRTILASPLTAAAAAVTGKISDPREFIQE